MSGYLRINLMYRWIVEAEASNKPEIPHYMKKVQVKKKKNLAAVGFEPTPHMWLVPKTNALDHSATLPPEISCF